MPDLQTITFSAPHAAAPDLAHGSVFFVGTATVILRYAGFTILTDPNFLHAGDHVHLGYGLTSERLTNPAIDIEDLPPLDFCLLSHLHGDHFDRIAEARLNKTLPIISTRHAASALRRKGFQHTHGLNTWETILINKGEVQLRLTAMPGKHGPGPVSALLPSVMGSMLEFEAGGRVLFSLYITGDTLLIEALKEIPRRYPEIDLSLIHLGGTMIMGLLLTMDGRQGVETVQLIRPKKVIPIHYNDYTVFKSPLEDFKREVEAAGLTEQVIYLSHGQTYNFAVATEPVMAY